MRLSLKPKCTCGSADDKHFFSCDLWYAATKISPPKRKRFWIFYPLKFKS